MKTANIQDLIQQYPNDNDLGEVIRAKYGKKKAN